MLVDVRRRVVQEFHGRLEVHQVHALADRGRHGVGPVDALHRVGDRAPQHRLRQAFAGRVHGRERGGQGRAFVDDLVARVDHLGAKEAVFEFTPRADAHAFGHLLDLAAVEIHEAQQQVARCIGDRHEKLAARLERDLVLGHDAFDLPGLAAAHAGIPDRDDLGLVLVAQRQVQHQVHVGAQAEAGELAFERFWGCCGFRGGHIAAKWRLLT